MKLPVKSEGFEKCPAGNHLAVCYEVLDIGTQETKFGHKHQIWIGWETPNETMSDGRPFVIGQKYTLSSNEKSNLRLMLESWRGKKFSDDDFGNFDIAAVAGKGCFLNVVHDEHDGNTYANIKAVTALPKGTTSPVPVNAIVLLDLIEGEFNQAMFDLLSDRMQGIIAQSPEYAACTGKEPAKAEPETADSTPF